MPAITIAQVKTLILAEVNDTSTGPVGLQIDIIWDMYAGKALVSPTLQYLYSLRKAIDLMLGNRRADAVDTKLDNYSFAQDQEIQTLLTMRENVKQEIMKVERESRDYRTIQIGPLARIAPIAPADSYQADLTRIDAGSRIYRGDPYYGLYFFRAHG